jgi:hypothetical protein
MNVQDNHTTSAGNGPSKDELDAVKRIFASLLLANKNLSLYPYGHSICMNSINHFYTQLMAFLQRYGTLRLEIERERILFRGEVISAGLPEEGTLHFTLFRDGIRWLEFMDGIEQKEINDILLIINKYTKLSAEPEGDIVTSFWEVRFPHLQYEVSEFSWGGDQDAGKMTGDFMKEKAAGTQLREKNIEGPEPQGDPFIEQAALMLTPQEQTILQEMIRLEEDADLTSYLDALLDSLLQHREEDNFSTIIAVLSEEFTGSLGRKDFMVTLKILNGLRYLLGICRPEIPWAGQYIEDFSLNASGPDSLAPLRDVWKHVDTGDAGVLGQIFRLLNPMAIQTLVFLLPQVQPAPLRQMLLDSIIFLASQDIRPLESILSNSDEKLVEKIVPIIINMEGSQSLKYLMRLTRHTSSRVRLEAVKGLLKRDSARAKDIFNLIDDKEESIRQLILKQIGQSRDNVVEELLLSYIQATKLSNIDGNHLIQCFRTLGKCGSSRSVPFLRETLLKWGWMPGFRRSTLRRGAAIALGTLGIPEAEQVLKSAGRSLYPGIRGTVRKVRQEL